MTKTRAQQALNEASISVACLLEDISVIESSELNLSELEKDIEHLQDKITILENHKETLGLQQQGWEKMDTEHGYAWFGGGNYNGLFDYLPQNIKENPDDFDDIDFLVCGWRKNSTDEDEPTPKAEQPTDDWITEEQLRKAKIQAKPIFQDFISDEEGDESDWTEIEIDGQYFDINCWDDDMKKPATQTYCAIYPTHLINGLRQTDGQRYKRLFIGVRPDDLEQINIFERVEEEKK